MSWRTAGSGGSPVTDDEALRAAVQAQADYELTVREAKAARSTAFRRALSGPVTAVELARRTGMSNTQVARIARGEA